MAKSLLVLLLAALGFSANIYYLPDSMVVPSGTRFRVMADNGGGYKVIQTNKPVDLPAHPEYWPSGNPVVDSGCLAQWEDSPAAVKDSALAAKAVTAKAILSASPKLKDDPAMVYQLELLAEAVEYAAGVQTDMTTQAVRNTQEIIEHPAIKAQPALRDAIKRAMEEIVQKTNGSIDP